MDVERHRAVLDDTPPPVEEAHELVAVDRLALAHDCSDHRVQSWAVAATGQQSDSHLVHVTRASARLYPAAPMSVIVAIDAGTTGVRAFAVGEDGTPRGWSYREFTQHFPAAGVGRARCVRDLEGHAADLRRARVVDLDEPIAAIGITNQRETVVVWDRRTGEPLHRAIVWQDRRTAERCDELRDAGHLDLVRSRTGLVLDPYFSATKLEWILRSGAIDATADVAFGTVDSWLLWKLTGGAVHATDASNASRTMLYDIGALDWSDELLALFSVPRSMLPEVRPSSGELGTTVATERHPGRHPDRGHRRRSTGRALRASVLRAGDDARTPTAPDRSCS